MAVVVGDLVVRLSADVGQIKAGMKQATDSLLKFKGDVKGGSDASDALGAAMARMGVNVKTAAADANAAAIGIRQVGWKAAEAAVKVGSFGADLRTAASRDVLAALGTSAGMVQRVGLAASVAGGLIGGAMSMGIGLAVSGVVQLATAWRDAQRAAEKTAESGARAAQALRSALALDSPGLNERTRAEIARAFASDDPRRLEGARRSLAISAADEAADEARRAQIFGDQGKRDRAAELFRFENTQRAKQGLGAIPANENELARRKREIADAEKLAALAAARAASAAKEDTALARKNKLVQERVESELELASILDEHERLFAASLASGRQAPGEALPFGSIPPPPSGGLGQHARTEPSDADAAVIAHAKSALLTGAEAAEAHAKALAREAEAARIATSMAGFLADELAAFEGLGVAGDMAGDAIRGLAAYLTGDFAGATMAVMALLKKAIDELLPTEVAATNLYDPAAPRHDEFMAAMAGGMSEEEALRRFAPGGPGAGDPMEEAARTNARVAATNATYADIFGVSPEMQERANRYKSTAIETMAEGGAGLSDEQKREWVARMASDFKSSGQWAMFEARGIDVSGMFVEIAKSAGLAVKGLNKLSRSFVNAADLNYELTAYNAQMATEAGVPFGTRAYANTI